MRYLWLFLLAACAPGAPAPAATTPGLAGGGPSDLAAAGAAGLKAISAASFEANTKRLSSDELEGRATGSEGGARGEQYIADQLAALGVAPAGEGGTYFQRVPLREATRDDAGSSLVIHTGGGDVRLENDRDALLFPAPRAADVHIDARLVFAGFGISRPDLGYDDLAGVDLNGAIAVVFRGAPATIHGRPVDSALQAVLSDLPARSRTLRARGAVAMFAVYNPKAAVRMSYAQYVQKIEGPTIAWLEHDAPASGSVIPLVTLDQAAFDRILGTSSQSLWTELDRGEPARAALTATAQLHIRSTLRDLAARNVVGVLRGSDPRLADELVLYTAHSDHLGIGPPVNGDRIYNGAVDNATGCAALLEVARAFRAMSPPPRRSTLFAAVTGEEKGLLGSDYFAHHPTVPLDRVVADINVDGINVQVEPFDLVVHGADHSSLGRQAAAAARAAGLQLSPDPTPELTFFIRSDQYSFVQVGIPSVFAQTGFLDATGNPAGYRATADRWSAQHYHLPSDEWQPEYNAAWGARVIRFDFLIGLAVAGDPERPRWNPGDLFGVPGGIGAVRARRAGGP
ncbi:MAG TPA: M28 family peptidase [Kofleriaceae bacterium]|nr:M28 family peptidase [Kofleriaceae bacterium]